MQTPHKTDSLRTAIRAIAQALREREATTASRPQSANMESARVGSAGHGPNLTGCTDAMCAKAA